MMEILDKHFKNPEQLIQDIYCNGGTSVGGYGFLSGGYGGGIEIDQAHRLMWTDGYISGLIRGNKSEAQILCKAINEAIKERDSKIKDEDLPFRNEWIISPS